MNEKSTPDNNATQEKSVLLERNTDFSNHPASAALQRFQANPRVGSVRFIIPPDACPACRHLEGEYEKANVPELPLLNCSHPLGCRSFYAPRLLEIYP